MTILRIPHSSEDELDRKLAYILTRRGYRVEKAAPERVTVGQLAASINRPVSTVSRALKRPSCPPFASCRGRKRILWLEPNERLLSFLRDWRKGAENRFMKTAMQNPTSKDIDRAAKAGCNLYRCNACGRIEPRVSKRLWRKSFCKDTGKDARLYRITLL